MNEVLSTLTGVRIDNPRMAIEQGYIGNSANTAGCYIRTSPIYSICKGVVLSAGKDPKNNTWCITIEVNSQRWIRYCNLASCKQRAGQTIKKDDFIGYAYRGKMRLEYCTSEESQFPVRESNKQLYKHDPSPIIFGQEILSEDA